MRGLIINLFAGGVASLGQERALGREKEKPRWGGA